MMPLNLIIVVEIFNVLFMGSLLSSFENDYILLAIDYASKWVEVTPTTANGTKVVVKFPKETFFLDLASYDLSLIIRVPLY